VDLEENAQERAFREEARAWLAENVPRTPLPSGDTRDGFAAHLAWEKMLFTAGWSAVSWPREFGGRDASVWQWLAFEEEYYRAGAPQRVTQNGIFLLAPTLFAFGTPEQQRSLLPRMAAADDLWCQGWSEPGAGSDLAALSSRAERDGRGGWRLSGHKTWTTRGAFCTHMFGLFRTDPHSHGHQGLTYFLVPLETEGVSVRGFARLDGDEGFADVFLDDVFVPEDAVLGEVGGGWAVAMSTTSSERGLTLRSPGRYTATVQRLLDLARSSPDALDGPLRARVVQAWVDTEAYRLFTLRQVTDDLAGRSRPGESSLNKLFWSTLDVTLHEVALDLLDEEAELSGAWSKGFQFSLAGPIYAGTNEVQRNIVAERLLGLPRR
jgi:alkylation response protein AidB-like acyl-CoA dehydrogenase